MGDEGVEGVGGGKWERRGLKVEEKGVEGEREGMEDVREGVEGVGDGREGVGKKKVWEIKTEGEIDGIRWEMGD